jgi:hypothetical protein
LSDKQCVLTSSGVAKLEAALAKYFGDRPSDQQVADAFSPDRATVGKIRLPNRKTPLTRSSIEKVFEPLDLDLSAEDYEQVGAKRESRPQEITLNPFGDEGCITDPNRLWGRDELLRQLFEVLDKGGNRSLIGPEGTGKSSLLRMVSVLGPEKMLRPIDRFIHLDLHLIRDGKTFWEVLCEELGLDGPLHGYRLERALKGQRFVVCLDEIARMTDTARFSREDSEELRGLADGEHLPLSLVIAAQRPLGELFPDESGRTSPLAGICHGMEVAVFGLAEARRFVADRLLGTGVEFKAEQLDQLWEVSQGNPKLLQRSAAVLYEEICGRR